MMSNGIQNNSDSTRQTESLQRDDYVTRLPYIDEDSYESAAEHDEEIHLRTYLHRVARHKWIVALTTLSLTLATLFYLWQQPDVYKPPERIQVDRESNAALTTQGKDPSPFD